MGNRVTTKGERRSAMVLNLNIRQKGLMGENAVITDEYGVVRYTVRGDIGILSRTFRIFSGEGEDAPEVAVVQRKQVGFTPRITVTVDGGHTSSVVVKTAFLNKRYLMEGVGLEAKGDWTNSDLMITRDGETVARSQHRILSILDREVTVFDEAFATLVVGMVLAIGAIDDDDAAIMATSVM